jgi:hypothetical protein
MGAWPGHRAMHVHSSLANWSLLCRVVLLVVGRPVSAEYGIGRENDTDPDCMPRLLAAVVADVGYDGRFLCGGRMQWT